MTVKSKELELNGYELNDSVVSELKYLQSDEGIGVNQGIRRHLFAIDDAILVIIRGQENYGSLDVDHGMTLGALYHLVELRDSIKKLEAII